MKKNDQVKIVDVFKMHEWYYKLAGIWPLRKDYIKFGIYLPYCIINVILAYIDMIAVLGNLHLMIENLLETLPVTVSLFMTLVVRFHPSLVDLIVTIKNELTSNDYQSDEERYLYYTYNRIAYTLSKIAMPTAVMTVFAMYLKPLPNALRVVFKSLGRNGTTVDEDALVLPFKGMQIFHISDLRIYFFLYLYRLPCGYLGICHTLAICFVLSLVLHVCGRIAMLNRRVKMIETRSRDELENAIRRQVQAHLQLIDMVKSIENIFQYNLLFDLVQTSLRLGLSSYIALTSKDAGSEFMAMCTFASYACVLFGLLYVYCFVGEYLTQEIVKTSMAYLSMLRAVV